MILFDNVIDSNVQDKKIAYANQINLKLCLKKSSSTPKLKMVLKLLVLTVQNL